MGIKGIVIGAVALATAFPATAQNVGRTTEKLGPGPHTLIISDGDSMTRIDYSTGAKCQKARDEIRRQNAPPPDTPGRIYGPPRVKAFCVPR